MEKGQKKLPGPEFSQNKQIVFTSFLPSLISLYFFVFPDADRMVNSYRKISTNNLELRVPGAPLHERIQLWITPDKESGLSEVRF